MSAQIKSAEKRGMIQPQLPHTYCATTLPDQRTRTASTWAMSLQNLVLEVCVDSVQSAIRLVILLTNQTAGPGLNWNSKLLNDTYRP